MQEGFYSNNDKNNLYTGYHKHIIFTNTHSHQHYSEAFFSPPNPLPRISFASLHIPATSASVMIPFR